MEKRSATEILRAAWQPLRLVSPALFVVLVLFLGGWWFVLGQSLGYFSLLNEPSPTLDHYRKLFADKELWAALKFTTGVAVAVTALSAGGGVALAVSLRKFADRFSILRSLLQVPLAIPHLAAAVVLLQVISPSGVISRVCFAMGLISAPADFPVFVGDAYGVGIILAYLTKEVPFVALMVLAVLVRVGDDYAQVARNLGASRWQTLRYVTLPLIAPSVIFSSLIVFAFVFGAFEVPFTLGRPYPAMLAVVVQRRFSDVDLAERPTAMAAAVLMSFLSAVLVWWYLRLTDKLLGTERPTILA